MMEGIDPRVQADISASEEEAVARYLALKPLAASVEAAAATDQALIRLDAGLRQIGWKPDPQMDDLLDRLLQSRPSGTEEVEHGR